MFEALLNLGTRPPDILSEVDKRNTENENNQNDSHLLNATFGQEEIGSFSLPLFLN